MKKKPVSGYFAVLIAVVTILGCGSKSEPEPQPTRAVLTLSTSGQLPAGTKIGGVEVTVHVPAGVTVKAASDSANPAVMVADPGVVLAMGASTGAETALCSFAATAANAIQVYVIKSSGFLTGDFATVNADIANGFRPAAGEFSLSDLIVVDLNGAPISGLSVGFAADIQ